MYDSSVYAHLPASHAQLKSNRNGPLHWQQQSEGGADILLAESSAGFTRVRA